MQTTEIIELLLNIFWTFFDIGASPAFQTALSILWALLGLV